MSSAGPLRGAVRRSHAWSRTTGLLCVAVAVLLLAVVIPAQVDGGVVEQVRTQVQIGDAMAPTVWAVVLGLAGLLLALFPASRGGAGESAAEAEPRDIDGGVIHTDPESSVSGVTMANLRYLTFLAVVLIAALVLMQHAGPWLVALAKALGSPVDSYHALRGDRPWKYTGYFAGGFVLAFLTMWHAGGRRQALKLALIAAVAVTAIALAYDLPFRNLQLPPNQEA